MIEDAVGERDADQAFPFIDHEEAHAALVRQVVDADLEVDAPVGGPDDDGHPFDGLEADLIELEPDRAGVLELTLQRVTAHQCIDVFMRSDHGSVE